MEGIQIRLKEFIEYLNVNTNEFAKRLGYERSDKVYFVINGKTKPSFDMIQDITKTFVELNIEWLISGEGEMIKKGNLLGSLSEKNVNLNVNPTVNPMPLVVTVDEAGSDNIVLVDTKAAAGYPTRYVEPEFYGELPAFKMPGNEYRHGTYRAFEVSGDSMHDTLVHGDVVIAQFVDSFQHMKEGYIHVIVTTDQVLVKRPLNRIQKSGKVILQSDNNAYPPYPIMAEDIRELWVVKANVTRFMPNRNRDIQKVLNDIMGRLNDVEEQIQAVSSNPVVKKKA